MAGLTNMLINPWVLHLQKLGLELNCPLCLKLLNRPVLLPCDHVFCDSCIHKSSQVESGCPVCKSKHPKKARRNLHFMESVISIYKSLNAAVSVHLPQLQNPNNGNYKNGAVNNSNSPKDGGSEDSEMIDKDVIKPSGGGSDSSSHDGSPLPTSQESNPRPKHQDWTKQQILDHLPLYEFESETDAGNHTPESHTGQAAKNLSDITASKKLDKTARRRICGDSLSHDDSPLSNSQEGNPNPKPQDSTVQLLMESRHSYDFQPESDNDPTDHVKAQKHQQLSESHTEQAAKRKCDITASERVENHQKVAKRQKKLMQNAADMDFNDNYTANSDDQLIEKTSISDQPSSNITICGFCQSATVSEDTGEMLHYSSGRPVVGDDIFRSNVIHVHSACIEWAPQVYYEADTVKNLKAELARGMKIKCTKCGLKGAALGCYVKSCRRSYHVPCAREISRCRWDYEDFLLLCPAHSSVKFPNEKCGHPVSRAEPLPKTNPAELISLDKKPAVTKDIVLCGSALSQGDKRLMETLVAKLDATISRYWNPSVTHVIASTDEKGACTRTLKVLMGILNGKWIINADWIKASLKASQPVDEEPFEIHIDTQGCHDGPKTARLRAATNKPKLFDGLKFYFFGDFYKGYKEDLQNLVKVAGGTILNTEDELGAESSNNVNDQRSSMVVYNIDPPIGCALGEEVTIIWNRANEAEALSSKTGSRVVGHTWLLESIAGYKLHPMVS